MERSPYSKQHGKPGGSPGVRFAVYLLTGALILALSGQVISAEPHPPDASNDAAFQKLPKAEWLMREYPEPEKAKTQTLDERKPPAMPRRYQELDWTCLPLDLSASKEFLRPVEKSWAGWEELHITLLVPSHLPEGCHVYFFTKNWDSLWRQIRLPLTPNTKGLVSFSLPLTGAEAAEKWKPKGHNRPWHQLTPRRIQEFGCKFEGPKNADEEISANIAVLRPRLVHRTQEQDEVRLESLRYTPESPSVGNKVTFRMQLQTAFRNPFDKADIDITAEILRPDGKTITVPAFYYEGFLEDPSRKTPPGLIPYGRPTFNIRFTPKMPGKYLAEIKAERHGKVSALSSVSFSVEKAPSHYKGFVERDPDHFRYLQYDTGEIFQGVGINLRTPYDTRYKKIIPFSQWEDKGLDVYRELFAEYEKHGINVAEVWMSSWWVALEWIPNAPGFHGVGHMNQYRAWLLDRIVELAEKHDVYLYLVLHNHGKFSTFVDKEWEQNPYNEDNGGFLDSPEEYFRNKRAKQAFKRYARYIVARWSYSPHILAWKLFSEINLTGNNNNFYKKRPMAQWHREMSKFLEEIDPYNHLVTTHWSSNYTVINSDVAGIETLDFLTTDAYAGSIPKILRFFKGTVRYGEKLEKPTLITEYGGSPHGDDTHALQRQVHLGLWHGWFERAAIPPMLWWFAFVDEQNLYNHYAALRSYIKAEDRRGMKADTKKAGNRNINVKLLRNSQRVLGWAYDRNYFRRNTYSHPDVKEQFKLEIRAPEPGVYLFQIWNPRTGRIRKERKIRVKGSSQQEATSRLNLSMPEFRKDFAFKLIPAGTE